MSDEREREEILDEWEVRIAFSWENPGFRNAAGTVVERVVVLAVEGDADQVAARLDAGELDAEAERHLPQARGTLLGVERRELLERHGALGR